MVESIDRNKFRIKNAWGRTPQIYAICVCADKNGIYPSCVRHVDSNGNMILSEKDKEKQSAGDILIPEDNVFYIKDGDSFDLAKPMDRAKWDCIKNSRWICTEGRDAKDKDNNFIVDGSYKRYGSADLYVECDNEISVKRVSRKEKVFKAQKFVMEEVDNCEVSRLVQRALLLGRNMKGAPKVDVQDYLLTECDKSPEKIIGLYQDTLWQYKLLVLDAIDRNIIKIDSGQYYYAATALGTSLQSASEMLLDTRYRTLYENIKSETYVEYKPQFIDPSKTLLNSVQEELSTDGVVIGTVDEEIDITSPTKPKAKIKQGLTKK